MHASPGTQQVLQCIPLLQFHASPGSQQVLTMHTPSPVPRLSGQSASSYNALPTTSFVPRFSAQAAMHFCLSVPVSPSGIVQQEASSNLHFSLPSRRVPHACSRQEASSTLHRSSLQKRHVEILWREFFLDPSQWWDNRPEKLNPRYPDFKHKTTQEGLWLGAQLNPPWVEPEVAAMAPGTVQWSLFSWNTRLARYVKAGKCKEVLELFQQMQEEGIIPDRFTFTPVLNAIARLRALEEGRHIHTQIIQSGCESDACVGSCLVDMYAKCGSIEDAWRVFSKRTTHDVVAWSAIIKGYVKCGQGQNALKLFRQMQQEGVEPDCITFLAVLNACASVAALEEGRHVHEQISQRGFESGIFLGSSLIDMYAKCGSIEDAWKVFKKMATHDVVSWNAMLQGCVKCGQAWKALELFQQMEQEGVESDTYTFVAMLSACASVPALAEGRHIHEQIIKSHLKSDVFLGSSLIHMYVSCGSIEDALTVFNKLSTRNVVIWNVIILGLAKCGQGCKALELFRQMQQERVEPEAATFIGVLNACASEGALEEGRVVHSQIIQRGFESDILVGSSLVDMYAKCGSIKDAWKVFNKMATRDVVAWSAMIQACVKCRQGQKAIKLFRQMQQEGVEPDAGTFVAVISACTSVLALEEGRIVHGQITRSGWKADVFVGNSLIDMYAKCGSIEDAKGVFTKMPSRDVVSWTTMLGGYAFHGDDKEAIMHFEWMCREGLEMNAITFVSLLSACSHGGLVDEGLHYFESMTYVYNVSVTMEHYACVVDLLGRAGRLDEAENVIKRMTCKPDAPLLRALLSACRVHGNVEMGKRIAKQLLELDLGNASGYVLLSNMYAAAGK